MPETWKSAAALQPGDLIRHEYHTLRVVRVPLAEVRS